MATSTIKTDFKGSVSATADGVKTISTLLNELYNLTDKQKVSKDAMLRLGTSFFSLTFLGENNLAFEGGSVFTTNSIYKYVVSLGYTGSIEREVKIGANSIVMTDTSATVPNTGTQLTLFY